MRKVDEAKEKINKMLEGDDGGEQQQGGSGNNTASSAPIVSKRQDGPLSEGEERDDEDYERWGTGGENSTKVG